MTCEQVKSRLSAFEDGELSSVLKKDIEAHLGGCPGCRSEFDALERLRNGLDRWVDIDPAADFPSRVMERLQPIRQRRWNPVPSLVYSLAFLFVFLFGFLISKPERRQPSPEKKMMDLSTVLIGTRHMGLASIQDQTVRLIQEVTNEQE